jgi:hypothetical protein
VAFKASSEKTGNRMRRSISLLAAVIMMCASGCANEPFLSGVVVGTAIGAGGVVCMTVCH